MEKLDTPEEPENVQADERENNYEEDYGDKDYPVEERMRRLDVAEDTYDDPDSNVLNEAQRILNSQRMPARNQEEMYNSQNQRPDMQYAEGYDDYGQQYEEFRASQAYDRYPDESRESQQQSNLLIMQYETVLQSVNSEFQKLLTKNKDTEEENSIIKMKLEQLQRAYENEINSNTGKHQRSLWFW